MRQPETPTDPGLAPGVAGGMTEWRCPVGVMAILLALLTVVLFWPASSHDFIHYDDPEYVTENPHVQAGLSWASVKWAFGNTEQAAYWAPLMWLSHIVAFEWFGMNPLGHHLINILLHAASTALVFLVFTRMTGAPWRSLLLAALFGWHPLRVESVAWVTERKDVLSMFFGMLTLWTYVRYAAGRNIEHRTSNTEHRMKAAGESRTWLSALQTDSRFYYGLALVCFACGLMSKAMVVTLPCVLLLLDWWPMGRIQNSSAVAEAMADKKFKIKNEEDATRLPGATKRSEGGSTFNLQPATFNQLLLEKIPFFLLAAAASCVTFLVQKQGGAVVALEKLPFTARAENALVSYCRYLGKIFCPTRLAVFYPRTAHWPMAEVVMAGVLLSVITIFVFGQRGRRPFLLMGWVWFVGTLVPVIQLVQSGEQAMADRFTYLPSLGIFIMVIWGAYELTRRWRHQAMVLSAAGLAATLACAVLTRQQLGYWQDTRTLFQHALDVTEDNYLAHKILGDDLAGKGDVDGAIRQYDEALRLKPDYTNAHNNLGLAYVSKGRLDDAIHEFQEALRLQPGYADAHNNLAGAYVQKGRLDDAIREYQETLRLQPDHATARHNLAIVLAVTNVPAGREPQ